MLSRWNKVLILLVPVLLISLKLFANTSPVKTSVTKCSVKENLTADWPAGKEIYHANLKSTEGLYNSRYLQQKNSAFPGQPFTTPFLPIKTDCLTISSCLQKVHYCLYLIHQQLIL
jgi:hypothetical protein